VTVPTARQLNCKIRAAEKFLAILFLLMADCQIYGKVIEDMENEILQSRIHTQKM